MEFKVRAVDGIEEKSVQEVEQELLDKVEGNEEVNQEVDKADEVVNEQVDEQVEEQPQGLSEEDVLSFIKERYNKEVTSVEDLFQTREEADALPEDVAAYMKFKKETGRGFEDFLKVNQDLDAVNPDKLLRDYLVATEKGLDEEDIDALMEDYSWDEELDDEAVIKKAKLNKKKAIAKAKDYFESQKEKYRIPLESSGSSISKEEAEQLEAYKQYVQQSATYEEELKRKSDWFQKKTDEVFNSEFKGFEFTLGEDKKVMFSPADATELKKAQMNANNFLGRFVDENGLIKDAGGYHRALAIAMNPEKFAKFFYEQGKAEATDDVMRKTKNVDMSIRTAPEVTSKGGVQIKSVSNDSGRGLRIKSRK